MCIEVSLKWFYIHPTTSRFRPYLIKTTLLAIIIVFRLLDDSVVGRSIIFGCLDVRTQDA